MNTWGKGKDVAEISKNDEATVQESLDYALRLKARPPFPICIIVTVSMQFPISNLRVGCLRICYNVNWLFVLNFSI